jgi:hypothetical protein
MTSPNPVVFLVDVDNTLLNNDRIQDDLRRIDELLDVELAVLLRAGRATAKDVPEIDQWTWP